jgi:hypothetical protein
VPEQSWLALEATVFRQPHSELWPIWNPRLDGSPVDQRFRKSPPANAVFGELNWHDNPFFPVGLDALRKREQSRLDPATYAHIWEGAYLTNSDSQVFANKYEIEEFTPQPSWDGPYQGGDFGFSQDPTAAVRLWIKDEVLYCEYEAGKVGLELDDTVQFVNGQIPEFDKYVTRWDSARPESISYLKRHGFPSATAVTKWPGSVEDGIGFMRSFRKIIIHPRCTAIAQEFRLYSYKIDRHSGDILPSIVDAHNHYIDACIAEGELITTERGQIPVENVRAGDMVWTRKGLRRVEFAGVTRENADTVIVTTTNGQVRLTPDHRVWTARGWTSADALRYGDVISEVSQWRTQKSENGAARSGVGGPMQKTRLRASISSAAFRAAAFIGIGQFMRACMGQSLTGCTFTTSTAIVATTESKTLNASRPKNIGQNIGCAANPLIGRLRILNASGLWQRLGTLRQKVVSYTIETASLFGKTGFPATSTAINAGAISSQGLCITTSDSVLINANPHGAGRRASMMSCLIAQFANGKKCATSIRKPKLVHGRVVSICASGKVDRVYDLTVEGEPEFYAGGVLVHNCRYALGPMIRSNDEGFFVL